MLLRPLGIADIAETLHTGDHYGDSVATGYLWNEDAQAYNEYRPDPRTIANDAAELTTPSNLPSLSPNVDVRQLEMTECRHRSRC